MSATSKEFFAAGMTHYGTAVETVESFKAVAHETLLRLVGARTWKRVKLEPKWQDEHEKYQRQTDIYVSISVGGRFDNQPCSIELGLWWHRDETTGVELYAGIHGAKELKWRKNVAPRDPKTRRFVGGTSYLLRPCAEADLSEVAQSLLDELEDAAAHAIKKQ